MDQEKIGKFISKLRKEKNLTQEEFAEKLGVTGKSVSRWENGKCMPDLSLLIPISKELGITVNELISGEHIEKKDYQEHMEYNFINTLIMLKKKSLNVVKGVLVVMAILCFAGLSFILIKEYKQSPVYLAYDEIDFKICNYNDKYYKMTIKTNFDDLGLRVETKKTDDTLILKTYRTREENGNEDLLSNYGYSIQLLEKNIEKVYYDSKLLWDNSVSVDKCKNDE